MAVPDRKPSYWAVIPATVRYDAELPPNAKLLYAEISALCDNSGYCFATNDYFAKNFELNMKSVQRLIKSLTDHGYIRVEVLRDPQSKEVVERRIYAGINPARESAPPSPQKCGDPPPQKGGDPSPQKCGVEQSNGFINTPQPPTAKKGAKALDDDAKALLNAYVKGDRELADAMVTFMEVRTALKAVNSARAIKTLLGELDRLSGGSREMRLLLVRQSITNSWKSVFPLKGNAPPPSDGWAEDREVI